MLQCKIFNVCLTLYIKGLKRQPYKMVKHTSNNSSAKANKLSVFDHFVGWRLRS